MFRNRRLLVAFALLFFANAVTAWWVKGDLEMAWLVGGPLIVAGGLLYGAIAAIVLRRGAGAAAAAFLGSCASAAGLAALAMYTPNGWSGAPPRAVTRAAERIAADPAALRAAAEKITHYPVQPATATVRYTPSLTRKIEFSFRLERRPAEAHIVFGFEAGPQDAFEFRAVRAASGWGLEPVNARPLPLTARREAFARLFPGIPLVEVGGSGPYAPGELIPVRLARSVTDWEVAVVRIAADGAALREIRRYSSAEIAAGLERAAARAGLGSIEHIYTYFRPISAQEILFAAAPAFDFNAQLGGPRYALANMKARLSRGELSFDIERAIERAFPDAQP
jgi:hypothetical protein